MTPRGLEVAPGLMLPRDAQTQTLVVYGGKGMGKTNFAAVLVEELAHNALRFCLLDPVGVSWGLKHSADGRGPGIEVLILGGLHGDIPIDPNAGAVVADLVVDEAVSTIVDISRRADGRMWTNGEKVRFVRDFCTQVYLRQGEERHPLMLAIDEAGRFVPQNIPKGAIDIAECMGAIEQLVEWGRNVGVGVALITQRSARMNKSVSELAEMMVAFRTVGPNSIAAIVDWFGEHLPKSRQAPLIEQLRELPVGTALVVSPGWLRIEGQYAMRRRETFDSSATPKAGQERRARGKGAQVDVGKYLTRMAETVERAKADDPGELRKRIHTLEQELVMERRKANVTAPPVIEQVETILEVPRFTEEQFERIVTLQEAAYQRLWEFRSAEMDRHDKLIEAIHGPLVQLTADEERIEDVLKRLESSVGQQTERALPAAEGRGVGAPSTSKAADRRVPRSSRGTGQTDPAGEPVRSGSISKPQQKILDALAWFDQVGVQAPRRSPLAAVAGSSPKSSGFEKNLSTLKTAGLIDYPERGRVCLTEEGQHAATWPDAAGSTEVLQEAICSMVSGPQATLLRELIAAYPQALPREELAARAGVSAASSGFEKNISTLRSFELIDYPERGHVVALSLLFLQEAA